jgi:NAD(P)-dependent dehydrogenase (short-subunit alcohol dehydrogenase family)
MRTALVTGASSGIGLEIALHFAREGYRVYGGARRAEMVEGHQNIVAIKLDVTDDASVRDCVASVGPVDVLVNNAGIGMAGTVDLVPMEKIRVLFETNFFGAVRMMQAVLPGMRERQSGTVVNITSAMGRMTLAGHAYYAATKYALTAVSETLAAEVHSFGIRVAIIEPGVVLTPIWGKGEYPMPAEHPYKLVMHRLERMFNTQLVGATMPDVVARAVYAAVEAGCPRLRYPVGADSEVLAAARDRMTAAEWMQLSIIQDEAEFVAAAEKVFGVDLYNPPSLNQRRLDAAAISAS